MQPGLSVHRAVCLILSLAVVATPRAAAQTAHRAEGGPAADSAALARAAWARATAALHRGDLPAARADVDRAAAAWPTQPAYLWGQAILAARLHDPAGVARALSDYAALGLGRNLADSTFDAYRGHAWFQSMEEVHRRNTAVLSRSRRRAVLRDSTFWPEGVDYDAYSGRFFVGSVRHRTIAEVAPDGSERYLWEPRTRGIGAILGLRIDAARGLLWATTAGLPQMAGFVAGDTSIAALLQIRLGDGRILRRIDLPGGRARIPGDIAIAENGDVYLSDSRSPALYRLRSGAEELEVMTHPLFRSLQGLAVDSAGAIYAADYSHGLLRVDFARRDARRLTLPSGVTTVGCDGIALHARSRSIIAVQNGVTPPQIVRFLLDDTGEGVAGREVLDRRWDIADEPTIGTLVGDEFVYVANSQWEKYDEAGHLRPTARLTRPVLLGVQVGR